MNQEERRAHAQERLPTTLAAIEEGRHRGLHLGAQIYVSQRGEVVADAAVGESRPGRPMRHDDLPAWLSSSKPVTAVALGQLWEKGRLGLDDPIAQHLPEFAPGGKEEITLRHALTHTGGFRMLNLGWPEKSWDEVIAKICAGRQEPRWPVGEKAGYHMASSWFILGEVVRRLDGRPFPGYVREEIFEPLGMESCWIGMPAEVYAAQSERLVTMYDTHSDTAKPLGWEDERHATQSSPAGGGRGPMRELGRFYEALLDGGRVLRPQTVEALTARHRVGLHDHTFKHVMDWGLGFIPDSKQYGETVPYAYGRHCSRRTWGHSGHRSSTGFADAQHGLAVAVGFNGLAADGAHHDRMAQVCESVYEDLGLVASGGDP